MTSTSTEHLVTVYFSIRIALGMWDIPHFRELMPLTITKIPCLEYPETISGMLSGQLESHRRLLIRR